MSTLQELLEKATKRPWVVSESTAYDRVQSEDGNEICSVYPYCTQAPANAELIVRAVNSIGPLVEALKALVEHGDCGCYQDETCPYVVARAALALAEGGEGHE